MKHYIRYIILIPTLLYIGCISINKKNDAKFLPTADVRVKVSSIKNKCDCKNECISVYYKGVLIDTMEKKCFSEMIKASKIVFKTQNAERLQKGYKIEIELEDNPWSFERNKKFKTYMNIRYIDDKKEVFKKIRVKAELEISKEGGLSKWRIIYRDVAEVGFPIVVTILLFLIILL